MKPRFLFARLPGVGLFVEVRRPRLGASPIVKYIALVAVGALLGGYPSVAQIVSYTFGGSTTPTLAATTTDSNVTASTFSSFAGNGGTGSSTTSNSAGGSGGAYFSANTFRTSDANYFSFTITPAAGYQVTLSSVSFYYLSTSTGPTSSALQSSSDNYASNLGNWTLTPAAGSVLASDWHSATSSITLSFTTATTFHITGAGASGSTGGFRVDDVTLAGSVSAIPEPSTYAAIFGCASLAFASWRRRRRPTRATATASRGEAPPPP